MVEAATSQEQIDRYILRLMFAEAGGDLNKLQWLQRVFEDPAGAVNVPQYRPYVAKVLQKFLDMLHTDSMYRTRVIVLQQREKGVRTGVNEEASDDTPAANRPAPAWYRALARRAADGTLADELARVPNRFDADAARKRIRNGLAAMMKRDGVVS